MTIRSTKLTLSALIALSILLQFLILPQISSAQEEGSAPEEVLLLQSYKPQFLSPIEITRLLGAFQVGDGEFWRWVDDERSGELNIRLNSPANLVLFNGPERLITRAMNIITASDIAPRQIEIEVRIVEINANKAEDLGYDWEEFLGRTRATVDWNYDETDQTETRKNSSQSGNTSYQSSDNDRITRRISTRVTTDVLSALHFLDENGFGSVRVAPRILTLNNRSASIIDGQRVTYVTRYSSYTNLYETDSMDAGLIIKATPSIGESGYITLDLTTEFTNMSSNISGSPIKTGQIIENTIIIGDGESALLGGFSRTVESVRHRKFPILGNLIPFLFSRKTTSYTDIETIIVLTPRIVDFKTNLGAREIKILDSE